MTAIAKLHVDEDDAIIDVICSETDAYCAADFERWASCWLHEERTMYVYSSQDIGLIINKGWDAICANMQRDFKTGDNCKKVDVKRENMAIVRHSDMAWVTYDEISVLDNGDRDESFQTRILERQNGSWKIALASLVTRRNLDQQSKQLAVTSDGQVVWMTKCMAEVFSETRTEHSGFTISAGRFRAAKPEWDKALQQAISCAAELHTFSAQHRFMKETGRGFRYPIILGEDDKGSVICCTLSVRDGMTYIDLDRDQSLHQRLIAAKVIFGLSDGQVQLSKLIANGQSLKAAADDLDISINTARTHLSRIYDKTGVNSQTALVRLLLSVG